MDMKFGDYCHIEKRLEGQDNKFYKYKVIGTGRANYYQQVPENTLLVKKGEMCDVVNVVRCGVREDTVETFRIKDVSPDKEEPVPKTSDIISVLNLIMASIELGGSVQTTIGGAQIAITFKTDDESSPDTTD